jgi:hypothetical protein
MSKKTETTQEAPKVIKIGEKHYSVESLTEKSINLFQDIKKVEDTINRHKLEASIGEIAKTRLYEELSIETQNLEEVQVQVQEETKE